MLRAQLDTNFLVSLPDRCGKEILVPSLLATARQSHMATPRITTTLSPADQENAFGIGSEDESYCGPE
jgi:hypothetical protein